MPVAVQDIALCGYLPTTLLAEPLDLRSKLRRETAGRLSLGSVQRLGKARVLRQLVDLGELGWVERVALLKG
jgi:hypothetical protein